MTHLNAHRAGRATPAHQPASKRAPARTPEAVLFDKQEAYERYMTFHKGRRRPPTGEPAPAKSGAGGGGHPAGDNPRTQAFERQGAARWPALGRAKASVPTYALIRQPFAKPAVMPIQQALQSAVVIPFPKRR
jgi:hypothetical protein